MQCATHPDVETELACGKCGRPICPRCMVYTPVGARCRECANLRKLPQYNISVVFMLRAFAAAAVVGAGLGVVWGVISPLPLLGFVAGLGVGYGVGEAVSLAVNRKSGPPLQVIAVAGVLIAFLVRDWVLVAQFVELRRYNVDFADLLGNDIYGWITAIIAAVIAYGRLR
jgi:hypothetical protein